MDTHKVNLILIGICSTIMVLAIMKGCRDNQFVPIKLEDIPAGTECQVMKTGDKLIYLCGEEEV